MHRVCLYTLGCKLNQAETHILKQQFLNNGIEVVPCNSETDFCLINACAVTQKAEKQTRQAIRQIKSKHSNSCIIVTGCFTKQILNNKDIKQSVDFWVNNQDKNKIHELILNNKIDTCFKKQLFKKQILLKKTRSLIKIQHGCKNYCTYCIVPYLRDKIYCISSNDIINNINEKYNRGFKEVVLVGTNIGLYNHSGTDLIGLLKKILKFTKIQRIRISSLWPTVITNEFVDLIKNNSRICPHIHLSIQSACDKILNRMNRSYSEKQLGQVIKRLNIIPNIGLTSDIIIGFPGETDLSFKKTCRFIKNTGFLKVHVFRFSPRPKTKAFDFNNIVNEKIKRERAKVLTDISDKVCEKTRKKHINKIMPVLFESKSNNYWSGFTPNYLKVFLKIQQDLSNKIINVKLKKLYKNGLIGEIYN